MGLAGKHVTKETGITQHSRWVNEENRPVRRGRGGSIRARLEKGRENPRVTLEPQAPEEREEEKRGNQQRQTDLCPTSPHPPAGSRGLAGPPRSCPECGREEGSTPVPSGGLPEAGPRPASASCPGLCYKGQHTGQRWPPLLGCISPWK